jgi:hypothetical protein
MGWLAGFSEIQSQAFASRSSADQPTTAWRRCRSFFKLELSALGIFVKVKGVVIDHFSNWNTLPWHFRKGKAVSVLN